MKKITLVVDNTKNFSLKKEEDVKKESASEDVPVSPNPHSVLVDGMPVDFNSKFAKDMWE